MFKFFRKTKEKIDLGHLRLFNQLHRSNAYKIWHDIELLALPMFNQFTDQNAKAMFDRLLTAGSGRECTENFKNS